MVKANKKSLDAKAYINGQVNKFREERRKISDEEARKQLAENFRETTSSDGYKEQLKIVNDDTDIVRKYARRKKGGDIKPEEFKGAKTEFYGKNMDLEFGEDFEKLDLGKKVDYIFEKFGDTDYAADLIIDILQQKLPKKLGNHNFDFDRKTKNGLMNNIFNMKEREDTPLEFRFCNIERKYGRGPVALRLHLFLMDNLNGENWDENYRSKLRYVGQYYKNITQKTLKSFMKGSPGAKDFLNRSGIINSCENGSISDRELLQRLSGIHINFKKLSLEGQKFFVDVDPNDAFVWDDKKHAQVIDKDINFLDESNVVDYVLNSLLRWYINNGRYTIPNLEYFCINKLHIYKEYHEEIANILVKMGKIDIVKKYINNFTGLSESKKAEIMGDTELEDKLNKDKFNSDLIKLQELGAKLGIIIEVKEKQDEQEVEEKNEETVENEEITESKIIQEEDKKKKSKGWRKWFGK